MTLAFYDITLSSSFSSHQNFGTDFIISKFNFITECYSKTIKHSYSSDVRQAGFLESAENGFTTQMTDSPSLII